jgi:hypothetical protein
VAAQCNMLVGNECNVRELKVGTAVVKSENDLQCFVIINDSGGRMSVRINEFSSTLELLLDVNGQACVQRMHTKRVERKVRRLLKSVGRESCQIRVFYPQDVVHGVVTGTNNKEEVWFISLSKNRFW